MTLEKLIHRLSSIRDLHGDLPVSCLRNGGANPSDAAPRLDVVEWGEDTKAMLERSGHPEMYRPREVFL